MTQDATLRPEDAPRVTLADLGSEPDDGERKKNPTQAETLLSLAADLELFHTADDEAYADMRIAGHRETHRLRGDGVRSWLARAYYDAEGRPPSAQALADTMVVLEGRARFEGEERAVFVRLAHADGRLYLDLGRADWGAVEVSADGWRLLAEPPVRFRRPKGLFPLPVPAAGGRLDELLGVLNLRAEDWVLLAGWLVMTLHPQGPYPILILKGEQGTGKTSAAEKLKAVIDPGKAALRPEPRELRDLMIAASNSWLLAFDNLSHIPPWLSDALCRISTGGGFAVRAHYQNDEEALFEATRPVLINGIDDLATRSDLLDRAVIIETQPIGEAQRRTKAEIGAAFEDMHPRLLGAVLDAAAAAIANQGRVHLDGLPRMADFALWVTAAEPALDIEGGAFLRAYAGNRAGAHHSIIDASPVASAVDELMGRHNGYWRGTPTELLQTLSALLDDTGRRTMPKTPRALSDGIRRLAPNLRAVGIEARQERSKTRRGWVIERARNSSSPASPASPDAGKQVVIPLTPVTQEVTKGDAAAGAIVTTETRAPNGFAVSVTHGDAGDAAIPALSGASAWTEDEL